MAKLVFAAHLCSSTAESDVGNNKQPGVGEYPGEPQSTAKEDRAGEEGGHGRQKLDLPYGDADDTDAEIERYFAEEMDAMGISSHISNGDSDESMDGDIEETTSCVWDLEKPETACRDGGLSAGANAAVEWSEFMSSTEGMLQYMEEATAAIQGLPGLVAPSPSQEQRPQHSTSGEVDDHQEEKRESSAGAPLPPSSNNTQSGPKALPAEIDVRSSVGEMEVSRRIRRAKARCVEARQHRRKDSIAKARRERSVMAFQAAWRGRRARAKAAPALVARRRELEERRHMFEEERLTECVVALEAERREAETRLQIKELNGMRCEETRTREAWLFRRRLEEAARGEELVRMRAEERTTRALLDLELQDKRRLEMAWREAEETARMRLEDQAMRDFRRIEDAQMSEREAMVVEDVLARTWKDAEECALASSRAEGSRMVQEDRTSSAWNAEYRRLQEARLRQAWARSTPVQRAMDPGGVAAAQALVCSPPTVSNRRPLQDLTALELCVEGLTSAPLLKACTSLKSLSLNVNRLSSPAGLVVSSSLVRLGLRDNRLSSLEGLSGLPTLRELRLDINHLTSLHELKRLPALVELSANTNHIRELPAEFAAGLISPQDPVADKTDARSTLVEQAVDCGGLQKLELYHNRITSVHPRALQGLASLTHLDLGRNQLRKLDGQALESCPALSTLVLSQNLLQEPPSPLCLPLLSELWLSGNQISGMGAWASCPTRAGARPSLKGASKGAKGDPTEGGLGALRGHQGVVCSELSERDVGRRGRVMGPGHASRGEERNKALTGGEDENITGEVGVWLPSLEVLHLQDNSLDSLGGDSTFVGCPLLRSFDASFNQLSTPDEIGISLRACGELEEVRLHDNPAASCQNYTDAVALSCPKLSRLDGVQLDAQVHWRAGAKTYGARGDLVLPFLLSIDASSEIHHAKEHPDASFSESSPIEVDEVCPCWEDVCSAGDRWRGEICPGAGSLDAPETNAKEEDIPSAFRTACVRGRDERASMRRRHRREERDLAARADLNEAEPRLEDGATRPAREQAVMKLQSVFRGFHVRRALQAALDSARYVDDEVDGLLSVDGGARFELDRFLSPPPELTDGWWGDSRTAIAVPRPTKDFPRHPTPPSGARARGTRLVGTARAAVSSASTLSNARDGYAETNETDMGSRNFGPGSEAHVGGNGNCPVSPRRTPTGTDQSAREAVESSSAEDPSVKASDNVLEQCGGGINSTRADQKGLARAWGLKDPRVARAMIKRAKRMRKFQNEEARREKMKNPDVRFNAFAKNAGERRTMRGAKSAGSPQSGNGGRMNPHRHGGSEGARGHGSRAQAASPRLAPIADKWAKVATSDGAVTTTVDPAIELSTRNEGTSWPPLTPSPRGPPGGN
eukprot:g10033.t1